MIRNLIAATACVVLMSGTALGQTTAPAPAETPAPLTVTNKELFKPAPGASAAAPEATVMTKAAEGQILAAGFLGKAAYNGDTDKAESIGKLNDLVIGPDGMVQTAVIGVGGFLGVGQKDVAVAASQLKLSIRSDGNSWLVLNTTKDQLNSAPAFDRSANFTDGVRSNEGKPERSGRGRSGSAGNPGEITTFGKKPLFSSGFFQGFP